MLPDPHCMFNFLPRPLRGLTATCTGLPAREGFSRRSHLGICGAALTLAALGGVLAAPAPPKKDDAPLLYVQVDRKGELAAAEQDGVLKGLAAGPRPQHLVVLIHGWDTPLYDSDKQYPQMARDTRNAFAARGLSVAVIGVRWASDAGPRRRWLPGTVAHKFVGLLGFPRAVRDPYAGAVPVARATGRRGVRQLLFALHDRYPAARLHLFAHSMGAEVALHAVRPAATPVPKDTVIFSPERTLPTDLLALAGADLDEDVALPWETPAVLPPTYSPRLWWLTVPNGGRSSRDRVLVLRKLARGTRAVGNVGPRLRPEQLDAVVRARSFVIDAEDIPRDHDILHYYSRTRLDALAGAAGELQNPKRHTSPLLETLDQVLAAPPGTDVLRPYLESHLPTVFLYALWRLEHQSEGHAEHLASGYLTRVAEQARRDPKQLEKLRAESPCQLVRGGLWPVRAEDAGKEPVEASRGTAKDRSR